MSRERPRAEKDKILKERKKGRKEERKKGRKEERKKRRKEERKKERKKGRKKRKKVRKTDKTVNFFKRAYHFQSRTFEAPVGQNKEIKSEKEKKKENTFTSKSLNEQRTESGHFLLTQI
jgi:hypothetical protein